MSGDLHCHSAKSDGSLQPSKLVELAAKLNIPTIAVTDHDTMAGVAEAQKRAKELSLEVIPGIELSTYDYKHKRKLHLLCYYPKKTDELLNLCGETLKKRSDATLKMFEKVKEKYPMTLNDLKYYSHGSMAFYKQHIIAALLDMGYTISIFGDLFKELFSPKDGWAYVGFKMVDSREAIKVVKATGGAAVLAHPGVYGNFDIIEELASMGLDGIEVSHPRQSKEDCKKAEEAAERFKLIKTGGSDFHGMNSSRVCPLGVCRTEDDQLKLLRSRFAG